MYPLVRGAAALARPALQAGARRVTARGVQIVANGATTAAAAAPAAMRVAGATQYLGRARTVGRIAFRGLTGVALWEGSEELITAVVEGDASDIDLLNLIEGLYHAAANPATETDPAVIDVLNELSQQGLDPAFAASVRAVLTGDTSSLEMADATVTAAREAGGRGASDLAAYSQLASDTRRHLGAVRAASIPASAIPGLVEGLQFFSQFTPEELHQLLSDVRP